MGKITILLGYILNIFSSLKKIFDVFRNKTPEEQTKENEKEKTDVEQKIDDSNIDDLNKDAGWKSVKKS